MRLVNLLEDVVLNAIADAEKNNVLCPCPRCRMDAAAIALNLLQPRYVVTEKGSSYARAELLELQRDIDVINTVVDAVKKVQECPHHDFPGS